MKRTYCPLCRRETLDSIDRGRASIVRVLSACSRRNNTECNAHTHGRIAAFKEAKAFAHRLITPAEGNECALEWGDFDKAIAVASKIPRSKL